MPRPSARRALTLVELLIVIAIILIVVALVAAAVVKLRRIVKSFERGAHAPTSAPMTINTV